MYSRVRIEGQADLALGQQEKPVPAFLGEYLQNHALYGHTQALAQEENS
jgi:hypothetical protein